MKKYVIYFIMAFLVSHLVFADKQTFENTIIVTITDFTLNMTNQTIPQINVTTEEDTHIYSVDQNQTNSFVFSLRRDVTSCDDVSTTLSNITNSFSSLVSTCDSITKAYGDTNKYYQLYAGCNLDKTTCESNVEEANTKISELNIYKLNYDTCNQNTEKLRNYISIQYANATNLSNVHSACSADLSRAESVQFIWAISGALLVGIAWAYEKRKQTPLTKRSKMLQGLNK